MKSKPRTQAGERQESGLLHDHGHDKAILSILQAVKKGDFSVRLPAEWTGMAGKIADEIKGSIELNALFQRSSNGSATRSGKRENYPSEPRCRKPGESGKPTLKP